MPRPQNPDAERPARRPRVARTATVSRRCEIAPGMTRVVFTGPDLAGLPELTFSDHYIKILFPPAGADYRWPFDPDALRDQRPPEQWPVTRTYTIRSLDRAANEMTVDFVVHGDEGLAGPWAAAAAPGDQIGFLGPGGAYLPDPDADGHLLVGDEAAVPAIAATLERLPAGAPAYVFLEVAGPGHHQPLPAHDGAAVHWVHRGGAAAGTALAAAVRAAPWPAGRLQVFVHGNAEMVRDLRRYLFLDRRLDRSAVSISGYWRTGHTEDRWQATKGDFNRQMEAEESLAP